MAGGSIELRKFPFPYHAALAICCDCDEIYSLRLFLTFMDYLNGESTTPFGTGLGLEVGSSFWFFNATKTEQLSYFEKTGRQESDFAPHCRTFWESGHIDILHAIGNFDEGGFSARYAGTALDELEKHDTVITAWVNHGNKCNTQNIGYLDGCCGADRSQPEYHFERLQKHGLRYICTRFLTHVVGQDARQTANVRFMNSLQNLLMKTKYRHIDVPIFDLQNRLLVETELQDGAKIWDFQRFVDPWGGNKKHDLNDLAIQLHPKVLNRLLRNEGFMLVYTHMFEGLTSFEALSPVVRRNLEYLAELYHRGELLVTTVSRLLRYRELTLCLNYRVQRSTNLIEIHIEPEVESLARPWPLRSDFLTGLTFYCDDPDRVRVFFQGKTVATNTNTADNSDRRSISIPWLPLQYPRN